MEQAVFSNVESLGKTGFRISNFTIAALFRATKIV
jgi:hypothetical protein